MAQDHVLPAGESWEEGDRAAMVSQNVGMGCVAGMGIMQQWLSWENNSASDLC